MTKADSPDSPTEPPSSRREMHSGSEEDRPGQLTSGLRLVDIMDARSKKDREVADRQADRAWSSMETQVKDLRAAARDEHDAKLRERKLWATIVVILVFTVVGFVANEVWSAMVPAIPTP